MHGTRTVEVLAELHRCRQLSRELRVASKIGVRDRLLEPIKILVIESMATVQGVAKGDALIKVDHQFDVQPDRRSNDVYCSEVVCQPLSAQAQLEPSEATFRDKGTCLVSQ